MHRDPPLSGLGWGLLLGFGFGAEDLEVEGSGFGGSGCRVWGLRVQGW